MAGSRSKQSLHRSHGWFRKYSAAVWAITKTAEFKDLIQENAAQETENLLELLNGALAKRIILCLLDAGSLKPHLYPQLPGNLKPNTFCYRHVPLWKSPKGTVTAPYADCSKQKSQDPRNRRRIQRWQTPYAIRRHRLLGEGCLEKAILFEVCNGDFSVMQRSCD